MPSNTPVRQLKPGEVARECPYNHPVGTRCPVCSKWPYPKGGAAAYTAKSQGPQWRLVPVQPTVEMVAAWHRQKNRGTQEIGAPPNEWAKSDFEAYAAMLAVAPAPPSATPPSAELAQLCQRLSTLLAQASPQPWVYRPDKFDDWGYIRGPLRDDRGIGPFRPVVAIGKDSLATDEQMNQHRRERTDPYAPNAQLITEAVNALPVLLAAVLNQLEQPNGAG